MNIFSNPSQSLVAALKDLSNAVSVSSKFKTLLMTLNAPDLSFNVFGAKSSPVRLLVRDFQCLQSKKSKSVLPVFEFFMSINRSLSARSRSPVTFKCLYIAVSLSCFTICLNREVDVASVTSGPVNDVSFTLPVFGIL